jgi:hypothetical protein
MNYNLIKNLMSENLLNNKIGSKMLEFRSVEKIPHFPHFFPENLPVLPSGGVSHQYSFSICDFRYGIVFSIFIISELLLTDFKHRSCNVEGNDEEYMTFIADFAAVEDKAG